RNTVSIFLATGSRTFGPHTDLGTGSSTKPNWIVAVDLTGDGKAELATANYGNATVSVFINNGSGAFAASVVYPAVPGTGYGLYDMVAGDFNKDGKQDLAVANHVYGRTGVYFGNGDGTLQTGQSYNVNSIALVAGDFKEDGVPDLATISYSNNSFTLLAGNNVKPLAEDPAGSGLRSGFGRGNLSIYNSDNDTWSFSANAGDTLTVAAENPGSPNASGLFFDLLQYNANRITGNSYFNDDYNGRG